jgi:DNA-binding transcriptional LysR family regulator
VVAAEQDLKGAKEKPKGVLEVCCFPTFAKARLLPAITRVRARHPELRVIVHELESADAIAAVRYGRCHLAISFAYSLVPPPDVPGLVSHPLIDEPVVLALPKRWRRERQPVALKRMAREDWIIGSRQTDDRQLAERACALAGFAPRMTHTIDDYDLMLRMVAAGLGVGFVPELALSFSDTKAVALRTPVGVPPLRRRIHALTRATLAASPMVRALLSALA